jgi:hypothetical protein
MSSILTETSIIGEVHEGLLQETVNLLSQTMVDPATHASLLHIEIGGSVTRDGGYQKTVVDMALFTPEISGGLGLRYRGLPQMQIIGEGYSEDYRNLKEDLIQTYQTLAVQRAMASLGYDVGATQVAEGEPGHNVCRSVGTAA